jgi:hypothetical protein
MPYASGTPEYKRRRRRAVKVVTVVLLCELVFVGLAAFLFYSSTGEIGWAIRAAMWLCLALVTIGSATLAALASSGRLFRDETGEG